MNTLSLESLFITEEEWVATESLGSMVKKASGAIWDAIKTLCKKILKFIGNIVAKNRQLEIDIQKIEKMGNTLMEYNDSDKAADKKLLHRNPHKQSSHRSIIHIMEAFSGDLSDISIPVISFLEEVASNKVRLSPQVTRTIHDTKVQLDAAEQKYPPLAELIRRGEFKERRSSLKRGIEQSKMPLRWLSDYEKDVNDILDFATKAEKDPDITDVRTVNSTIDNPKYLTAKAKQTLYHKIASICNRYLALVTRLATYTNWQIAEMRRGLDDRLRHPTKEDKENMRLNNSIRGRIVSAQFNRAFKK